MNRNINTILKEVLEKVKPREEELNGINLPLKNFVGEFEKNRKKLKIDAQIFVGGSFAKKTLIKKDYYDIDIFIRFDKKHNKENLSNLLEKIIKGVSKNSIGKIEKIHGSRDYFRVKVREDLFFEIVPVKKIKNQKEAENVTDLSYFHVNYVNRKLKGRILDEVLLTKAFCHASGCYGAESYIKGFSGYALELLIYHYKTFLKFINAMAKVKEKEKLVIDTEKYYKNKTQVLMDINSAKLQSPIILIDPTHKSRNILAALSEETFKKFQLACKNFLRNPHEKAFENKGMNFEKIEDDAKKKNLDFILLEARTNKQEGDIAGSKLLKFYNHLGNEIKRYFEIKDRGFEYNGKKTARFAFAVKEKGEIIINGPSIDQEKHMKRFKSGHKKTFVKNKRIYAREKTDFTIKEFLNNWKKKNVKVMGDMSIEKLTIL
mgnify:CR=1 FL=1